METSRTSPRSVAATLSSMLKTLPQPKSVRELLISYSIPICLKC